MVRAPPGTAQGGNDRVICAWWFLDVWCGVWGSLAAVVSCVIVLQFTFWCHSMKRCSKCLAIDTGHVGGPSASHDLQAAVWHMMMHEATQPKPVD
jgi:hypothetical protein